MPEIFVYLTLLTSGVGMAFAWRAMRAAEAGQESGEATSRLAHKLLDEVVAVHCRVENAHANLNFAISKLPKSRSKKAAMAEQAK